MEAVAGAFCHHFGNRLSVHPRRLHLEADDLSGTISIKIGQHSPSLGRHWIPKPHRKQERHRLPRTWPPSFLSSESAAMHWGATIVACT